MDTPTVTVMQTVIAAMGDVFTLVGTVITKITEQPVLLFLLAAGLIPVGIRIILHFGLNYENVMRFYIK